MENHSQDGGSPPSRSTQMLMQMMSQLTESMQALRAERDNDREETRAQIQALQSAIATPNHTSSENIVNPVPQRPGPVPPILSVNSPPTVPASGNPITRKKPTLPNPPKFDGTRRNFRPWYLEMRAKLILDRDAFASEGELFAYIYARLEGTAQNMSAAYFEQGGPDGTQSPEHFLDYLNRRYGDPNAKSRALDRLRSLRQRPDESFATFFPKFEKELADSGGGGWDDAVQINYLEGAVNYKLRDRLIGITAMPTTFNEYAELLLTIGSRLDSREYQARSSHQKQRGTRNAANIPTNPQQEGPTRKEETSEAAASDQMDWEPTKVGKAGSKKSSGKTKGKPSFMCYRCGQPGHSAKFCEGKILDGNRSQGQPQTRVARAKVETPKDAKPNDSEGEVAYETASDGDSENE